jgi:hypothetical protein
VKDVLESLAAEVGGNPARFNQGSLNSARTGVIRAATFPVSLFIVILLHLPSIAFLDKTAPAVES